jgi:hypothetical protein
LRANRAYRLIIRRGGWIPASLADSGRLDHVEVVDVASGEAVISWDLPPLRAVRLARALRADLSQLEPADFLERWVEPRQTTNAEGLPDRRDVAESDSRVSESDSWVSESDSWV